MRRANKIVAIAVFFALGLIPCSYAQESITISTYYPSPFGVYRVLRLFPGARPTLVPCEEGSLYYDNGGTGNSPGLYVCDATANWQVYGGFWLASATAPNDIYNTNTGNVGIGTTSPGAKLDVVGDIRLGVADDTTVNTLWLKSHWYNGSNGSGFKLSYDPNDSKFKIFREWGGWVATPAITIKREDGNVGIGGSDPPTKLEIVNDGTTGPLSHYGMAVRISQTVASAAGGPKLEFYKQRSAGVKVWSAGMLQGSDVGDFAISEGGGCSTGYGTPKLVVQDTTGNVGIGTTSPGAKLDINGSLKVGSGGTVMSKIFHGQFTANGSWTILQGYDDFTQSVPGATTNAYVLASIHSTPAVELFICYARITNTDELTVRVENSGSPGKSGAITIDYLIIEP